MYFTANTVDDLMRPVLDRLLKRRYFVSATRGNTTELNGVLLKLANPLARLSRSIAKGTVFSCVGELLWYLSKGKELKYIEYYLSRYGENSEDGKTVYGAYGPRLFGMHDKYDQVENVLNALKRSPSSRRAVIQIFDAKDIASDHKKEIPCTCSLQFMVRRSRLEMFTYMRSNDAYIGLPHDIFAFTMIQEIFARSLNVEVGSYKHAVGSLHLYEDDFEKARKYLNEGWQRTIPMDPMPPGDPWGEIRRLLREEKTLRISKKIEKIDLKRHGYWGDLVRLLAIFRFDKLNQQKQITILKKEMSSKFFNPYILRRELRKPAPEKLRQMDFLSPSSSIK